MVDELVSVIMPVYNVEKYVGMAIQSVIDQSYDNWELIIIDDGSSDKSSDICDSYSEKNENVLVFHIENHGVANARNYGVKKARGEYIVFLDSDDELDKDFIKKMVARLIEDGSDMVTCNYRSIGENFETKTQDIEDSYRVDNSAECFPDYLDNKFYIYVIWAKLYRRSILKNLEFKNMKIGEDTCFVLELLLKGIKISFLNFEGYVYRSREDSITKIREFNDKDIDRLIIPRYFYDLVRAEYRELEIRALDNLCYAFIRITRILLENDRFTINAYYKAATNIIAGTDYMKSTIGTKRKMYIKLFIRYPMLAKRYARLIFD